MSKRVVYTDISPLPPGLPRELVLEFLHNHIEMIDLNPLIKERHPIPPPPDAPREERRCAWYSLTDKISYIPGGKAATDVSYTAAFNDLPNGIQTHCRAPLGVDVRSKWTLNGSLPGEPPERAEIGIGAPATGLYIREDVEIRCNVLVASFVKKTTKKAHLTLVERLAAKAKATANLAALSATPALQARAQGGSNPSSLHRQSYLPQGFSPVPTLSPPQGGHLHGHGYNHSVSNGRMRSASATSPQKLLPPLVTPSGHGTPNPARQPGASSPYYPSQRRYSAQPVQQAAVSPWRSAPQPHTFEFPSVLSLPRAAHTSLPLAPSRSDSPPPPAYTPDLMRAPSACSASSSVLSSPISISSPDTDDLDLNGDGDEVSLYPNPLRISKSVSNASSYYYRGPPVGSIRGRPQRQQQQQQQQQQPSPVTAPGLCSYPEMNPYEDGDEDDGAEAAPSRPPPQHPVLAELQGSEAPPEGCPRIMMVRHSMQPYDAHPLVLRPGNMSPAPTVGLSFFADMR